MKLFSLIFVSQLLLLAGVAKAITYVDDPFELSRRDIENSLDEFYARQDILESLTTRALVEELETRLSRRGHANPAFEIAKHMGGAALHKVTDKLADRVHGHKSSGQPATGSEGSEDPSLSARSMVKDIKAAALSKIHQKLRGFTGQAQGSQISPDSGSGGGLDGHAQAVDMGDGGAMQGGM